MDKPEIAYPCQWQYRIVTADPEGLMPHVAALTAGRTYTLEPSRQSKQGNYQSFQLELEVQDQADRDAIFAGLKDAPDVKLVL